MPTSPSRHRLAVPVLAVALVGAALAVHLGIGPPDAPRPAVRQHALMASPPPAPTAAAVGATSTATPTGSATPSPTASAPSTPAAPASQSPAPPDGKGEPTAGPSTPTGYPYPVDASGDVRVASLTVSPPRIASGGRPVRLAMVAAGHAWVPGQAIFVYVGQRFVLRLGGPGASGTVTVSGASLPIGRVVVSGFQFPQDSPSDPVDGAATATLTVAA